jgi:hypothetical protein
MLERLNRDRAVVGAVVSGLILATVYLVLLAIDTSGDASRAQRLLTLEPWYCDVLDPQQQTVVARSVEIFHLGGTLEGRTRLEDRGAGRVLLEFSYRGVWQFEDPWLTESISDYAYLHVDDAAFSTDQLAAIEAEFAEPEVSRVHALTEGQLVYGAHQSLYQCHRRPAATRA